VAWFMASLPSNSIPSASSSALRMADSAGTLLFFSTRLSASRA
jgi:hypothetical protein